VVIADQVPVKVAPDVIKNTNVKIAHRIVAADDRTVLAGAMAMNESQSVALATLERREAAVFSEGDDAPLMVRTPHVDRGEWPSLEAVTAHMVTIDAESPSDWVVLEAAGPDGERPIPEAILRQQAHDAAREVSEDPNFRRDFVRLIVSMTEQDDALGRLWNDLRARAQPFRRPGMDEDVLLRRLMSHASEWFAQHRGGQRGWTYSDTAELGDKLREVLVAKHKAELAATLPDAKHEDTDWRQALKSFRLLMYRLHAREFEPFPGCATICKQEPAVCLYRNAVADLVGELGVGARDSLVDRH
jgi:hypothetical protein